MPPPEEVTGMHQEFPAKEKYQSDNLQGIWRLLPRLHGKYFRRHPASLLPEPRLRWHIQNILENQCFALTRRLEGRLVPSSHQEQRCHHAQNPATMIDDGADGCRLSGCLARK